MLTGVLYIVLEIRQHNFMWIVGVLTSAAAVFVFWRQSLFASAALNIYYFIVSFVGLWRWRLDRKQADNAVLLRHVGWKSAVISAVVFVAGTAALQWLVRHFGDPMSVADVAVAVLSAVATWWLVRAYCEQWFLWIVADLLSTVICVKISLSGQPEMWWMAILYSGYTVSAVYGWFYWRRNGKEIH